MKNRIQKITVKSKEISIILNKDGENDYISLTDMVKGEDGDDHIRNWMRNKNTIEYLGIWEQLHNPNFKGVEFDTFMKEAGAKQVQRTASLCFGSRHAKYYNFQVYS